MSMPNKVVLVAGGTGGLGRAVSLAFVEAGARVIVTFQRRGDLDDLKSAASAKLVAADGASLDGFMVDVTDEAAVAKLIDGIVERHGRLDCLVNAVGAMPVEQNCGSWKRKSSSSSSR
jgi:NAD(P)-dependent dehydrogenase (short-subunit alcohol dehydrogenase family)